MFTEVIIYRQRDGGGTEQLLFRNDGSEVIKEMGADGSYAHPSFAISMRDDWLPAFAEAISNAGIKLPEASHTEGVLKAQTAHLQDLRQLLKLNNQIVNVSIKAKEDIEI